MQREELASALSYHKRDLVTALTESGEWRASIAEVRAALEVVVDDLVVAGALGSAGLLDRALGWWKVRIRSLGGAGDSAEQLPGAIASQLAELAPECLQPEVLSLLEHAGCFLRHAPNVAATGAALHPSLKDGGLAHEIVQALLGGDRITIGRIVADERRRPAEILGDGFEPALREIGARWQNGNMDPSIEHLASRIAHEFIGRLGRRVSPPPVDAPLVAMVRVSGNEHSLGQDCLRVHFAAAGLRARTVFVDSAEAPLLETLAGFGAGAVAISCMLPAQLLRVRELVGWIRRTPELGALPVLVGGGMFADIPQLATQVGADATAVDGPSAAAELSYLLLGTGVGR